MNNNHNIDIIEYIKILKVNKKQLFINTLLVLILVLSINILLPKNYASMATFVLPADEQSLSTFSSYSALFSNKGSNSRQAYIKNILNSRQLKELVIRDIYAYLKNNRHLKEELLSKTPEELNTKDIIKIIQYIKLNKTVSLQINFDGLYTVKVLSKSPELSVKIINSILSQINILNENLEIFPKRNTIIVLDEPLVNTRPSSPKILRNTLILPISFLFLNIFYLLIRYHLKTISKYFN